MRYQGANSKLVLFLGLIVLRGLSLVLDNRNMLATSKIVSIPTELPRLSPVNIETIQDHDDTCFYDRLKKCIPCSPEEERELAPYIPRLIIAGTQKSGTTLVYNLLVQHPNVSKFRQESQVFDQPPIVQSDTIHQCQVWNQYKGMLDECKNCQKQEEWVYNIDKTPAYLFQSHLVPSRLACAFPNPIKLLILLRDPTDRSFSHYQMMLRNSKLNGNVTPSDFFSLMQLEKERIQSSGVTPGMKRLEGFLAWKRFHSLGSMTVISRSLYALQLSHWIDTLSALWDISREKLVGEYFLVLDNEVVKENPQATMDRILEFAGLPAYQFDLDLDGEGLAVHNYVALTDQERAFLDDFYQPFNVDLYHLLKPYGIEIRFAKRATERSN
eukprot:Nitzschia sp. Nitz4//scaffold523_size3898//212//1360//NITZ4_009258-RA/size3898-processed-gene-0.0-mRNA-1//1//CDS//3329553947//6349//frame0